MRSLWLAVQVGHTFFAVWPFRPGFEVDRQPHSVLMVGIGRSGCP